MDTNELLSLHDRFARQARNLMERKNHDYAGNTGRTPFVNFEVAGHLGLCSTAQGVLIRLSDKLSRLAMFERSGEFQVSDEAVEDTVLDIINYAVIYGALKRVEAIETVNLEDRMERARLTQPAFDFPPDPKEVLAAIDREIEQELKAAVAQARAKPCSTDIPVGPERATEYTPSRPESIH